jgi:hypothetical protein
MSYLTYAFLTEDVNFGRRSRACINETANSLNQSDNPAIAALATDLLKQEALQTTVMLNSICAGPNFSIIVDNGDGTIDSTKISDEDIKAHTQAMFTEVAWVFYPDLTAPPDIPPDEVPPDEVTVTDISPISGDKNGGTTVTITGTGLTGTTDVTISNPCTNVTVVSDTTVTAITPTAAKATFPVIVTVDGVEVTGPNYQYI